MHKSFYIIWTILLLLIGSILLGYFINKALNPSRYFSVELNENTEKVSPIIEEEEPAFEEEAYPMLREDEFSDVTTNEMPIEPEEDIDVEADIFRLWDSLDIFQERFNEAALLINTSFLLESLTVEEVLGEYLYYSYRFSDTHALGGLMNKEDGSISGISVYMINDDSQETLDNLLDTIYIAVAAANPISEIDTNVEDIIIDLFDDNDLDYYNMDSLVELFGKKYKIKSHLNSGFWFSIYDAAIAETDSLPLMDYNLD